jgi:transposase, IS6 family
MFPVSYRDLELMLLDRGVEVDHTTIFRWIQAYATELEKRIRPRLRMSNGSWRVDETYIRVKGRWTYLYRAVDSRGQTIDFLLSARRLVRGGSDSRGPPGVICPQNRGISPRRHP